MKLPRPAIAATSVTATTGLGMGDHPFCQAEQRYIPTTIGNETDNVMVNRISLLDRGTRESRSFISRRTLQSEASVIIIS